MKIKTSELSGAALDWAVAKCEAADDEHFAALVEPMNCYCPSELWEQAGPIIEQEKLIFGYIGEVWECRYFDEGKFKNCEYGPTPLTAAMRCYVASKLGDTVDVPDELA